MLTLSPASIRMRCLRILPDIWAMMAWPFSSSTRNLVSGNTSLTTPSISMTSSFATYCPPVGSCEQRRARTRRARHRASDGRQVRCRDLAVGAALELERDLLVLRERGEPRTFDGGDVDEHVLRAVVRLN